MLSWKRIGFASPRRRAIYLRLLWHGNEILGDEMLRRRRAPESAEPSGVTPHALITGRTQMPRRKVAGRSSLPIAICPSPSAHQKQPAAWNWPDATPVVCARAAVAASLLAALPCDRAAAQQSPSTTRGSRALCQGVGPGGWARGLGQGVGSGGGPGVGPGLGLELGPVCVRSFLRNRFAAACPRCNSPRGATDHAIRLRIVSARTLVRALGRCYSSSFVKFRVGNSHVSVFQ
jgi:hypothetical protein